MAARSERSRRAPSSSVGLEGRLVIALEGGILAFLAQVAISGGESIELASHEAAKRVLRRAYDGFAAHVEAGIHEHRAAGSALERREQRVVARVGVLMHGLHAGRVVDVCDGRNLGAR